MAVNFYCFQRSFPDEIMEQIIFFSHPKHWFLVSKIYTQLLATPGFKARFIAHLYHVDPTKGLSTISPKFKSLFSIDVLQVLARAHSRCLHACNEYLLYLCAKNVMITELTFLLDHGADPNAGFVRYIGFDPARLSFIEQIDDGANLGGFRYHSIPIESDDKDKRSVRDAEDQGPFLGIKNAFICAAKSGRLEIVKLLIDHGLDVSRDTLGLLPWYCDKVGYKEVGRVIYSSAREKGFVFSWWP